MTIATPIPNAINVSSYHYYDNILIAEVDYDGSYQEFKDAPAAIMLDGHCLIKTGHNSDTMKIYYRSDCKLAVASV